MNKMLRCTVVLLVSVAGTAWAVNPTAEEQKIAQQWMTKHLGDDPAQLPFSFTFNGKPSKEALRNWSCEHRLTQLDAQRTEHTLTYTDLENQVVLRCEAIEYRDFPTVEWTIHFRNAGNSRSPIIEDIRALDVTWQRDADCEYLLHHAVGSPANGSDYGPLETPLGPGATQRISAAGGRPTNSDWSYFNLQFGEQGAIMVVGWPGQWSAEFARDQGTGIRVRAGQELTRFSLLPGEEVRSPLIVLQFWKGTYIRSQNIWRRWMMAHSMPRPGGKLPPTQFVASSSRAYEEMIGANEANQIMHIDRYLEEGLKIDYWWMDAGWYIQQRGWPQVGTWEVDPKRFPRGFRPISDHAHSKGVKILVWFEPERVMPDTWLYENHPEWLLKPTPNREGGLAGMRSWSADELGGSDPCVSHNPTPHARTVANIRWEPGQLSFHPGPKGEYSVVRFTASETGAYDVGAMFTAIDQDTTTEVFVLQDGEPTFHGWVNLHGQEKKTGYDTELALTTGSVLDFVVGWGNGSHICDSTGLEIQLVSPSGKRFDAAKDFNADKNPYGPWSYGYLKAGDQPESEAFRPFGRPNRMSDEGMRLFNLGNPAARQWLTDHVDRMLTEEGIDLYRQDFNMDPLAYWRAADAPDRQGITEIRHVTGYLAYWDELRRRHPNMLIDSCASGGRRNDLETMRRAVPLWRSDYAFEATGHQCMTYGLSFWLPYHGTGTVASASAPYYGGGATAIEPYAWWSNAAPSLGSGIDIRVKELDYDALRRLYKQYRQISPYFFGDYYPLTPWTRDNKAWMAWQFDRPETGDGVIMVFRRPEVDTDSICLKLSALDPAVKYELTNISRGKSLVLDGGDLLAKGLPVTISESPGVANFIYHRLP
jgi:alpha-galactosidase